MFCYNDTSCLSPTIGAAPQMFTETLQFILATQCLLTGNGAYPEFYLPNFKSFDFIIIGGGTTGSVIANRLSEVKGWRILLIEAGEEPPVESQIPGLDYSLSESKYNWKFLSTNNEVIDQAIINGSIKLSRGKMFGGSSCLDEMHYIRGHDQDYKDWFDEGNVDWTLNDVKRCFRKAENLQSKKLLKDPTINKFYGNQGPLIINRINSTQRYITNGILKACHEIGFNYVPDLNVAGLLGAGIVTATATDGVRQSTNRGYLEPIKTRWNLKILKNAHARKILITKDSHLAFGVELEKDGKILTFYATREVILAAGAVSSPQLLMLSGIGPEEHLRSMNITCLHNSPMVGQNLQDHLVVPITIYGKGPEKPTTTDKHRDVINYVFNRTGRLAESSIFTDITAFYSTKKNILFNPECQLLLSIMPKNMPDIKQYLKSQYRYKDPIINSIEELNQNHSLYFFAFNLVHPHSRGKVYLSSDNPIDAPIIFPNYFNDLRDLKTVTQGIKIALKLLKTTFFKNLDGFLGRMNWPACNDFNLDSDEYWECISMNMVTSMSHLVGTCKMGSNSNTSVVDSRLRVHGVSRLRVIDASVMPKITSGSITAPSIMVAERGMEFIKEDYKKDLI